MVADQHDLALDVLDLVDELREIPSRNHPRLIHHEYAPLRQTGPTAATEIAEQSGDARALDAGAGLQLVRRPPSSSHAEDGIAAACHASRAAPSANVLPVPAFPATTATPSPSRHNASIIRRCSS